MLYSKMLKIGLTRLIKSNCNNITKEIIKKSSSLSNNMNIIKTILLLVLLCGTSLRTAIGVEDEEVQLRRAKAPVSSSSVRGAEGEEEELPYVDEGESKKGCVRKGGFCNSVAGKWCCSGLWCAAFVCVDTRPSMAFTRKTDEEVLLE